MARRKAAPKGPDRQRRKRYAIARGRGLSRGKAAEKAGFKSKRAKRGVTGYELEKDERVLKLMHDVMAKDMSESEVKNRRAAQARGEIPTKTTEIVLGNGKREVRIERDADAGLTAIQKILGMNSETHRLELPGDREEALLEVQKVLALFGVKATVEEISAKLEAVSE